MASEIGKRIVDPIGAAIRERIERIEPDRPRRAPVELPAVTGFPPVVPYTAHQRRRRRKAGPAGQKQGGGL